MRKQHKINNKAKLAKLRNKMKIFNKKADTFAMRAL